MTDDLSGAAAYYHDWTWNTTYKAPLYKKSIQRSTKNTHRRMRSKVANNRRANVQRMQYK